MARPRKNAVVEGSDPIEEAPNPFEDEPVPPAPVDHNEVVADDLSGIVPEDTLSPPTVDAPPSPVMAATVKVRCIVKNNPWTDVKPLEYGEEAEVSREIAELMRGNHQVEIIG